MITLLPPSSPVSKFFYVHRKYILSQKTLKPCEKDEKKRGKPPSSLPFLSPSNGILTIFPFNSMRASQTRKPANPSHFLSYLTNLLGSTHSDRNALHPKPFSTSVQSVLNFVN